jgi:hypothetical protein
MPVPPVGYQAPPPLKPAYGTPAAGSTPPASGSPGTRQLIPVGGGSSTTIDYSNALSSAPAQPALTVKIPAGAKVYTHAGSTVVMYTPAPGVTISFDATAASREGRLDLNGMTPVEVDDGTWGGPLSDPNTVTNGGSIDKMGPVGNTYSSFQEFWDSAIMAHMGQNNPARSDPGVLKVLAKLVGRPDMGDAELQGLLQQTDWYQHHTQGQLAWNDLSGSEQSLRRADMADKMAQTYMQYLGTPVDVNDPRITNYLDKVASGQMGYGEFTEAVKTLASSDQNSAYSRQVQQQQDARGQRTSDISNKAQQIRDIYHQWGVPLSTQSSLDFAAKVIGNTMSDGDVLQQVQAQAKVLYPWKDPLLDTTTAAAPWLETYKRVMEKPTDLYNPQVQAALVAGQPVFDFEKQLKMSDAWFGTQNGQQTMEDQLGAIGRRMGYE